ncbi:SHOCT domain-containing protein [Methanomassiliicoccus luminyensis]|uniref:SHOCT domain-containing protein n=1 Tax=Methanomassiliicoccus luminyensis TaxID=1080712 RepID=UPI00036CF871|nr:SHOCT domain-containing protein [Methanomassiliicoccus luminyensis]
MLSDRKTAFWIVTTLIVALFVVFVLLAAVIKPDTGVPDTITNPELKSTLESLRQAVWWTTIAMYMLPIMMMLIMLAMYLFITGNPAGIPPKATAPTLKKGGLSGIIPHGKSKKAAEPAGTSDVLDLRYARGEITREQYLAMKEDLKVNQASQAPQAQQPQM